MVNVLVFSALVLLPIQAVEYVDAEIDSTQLAPIRVRFDLVDQLRIPNVRFSVERVMWYLNSNVQVHPVQTGTSVANCEGEDVILNYHDIYIHVQEIHDKLSGDDGNFDVCTIDQDTGQVIVAVIRINRDRLPKMKRTEITDFILQISLKIINYHQEITPVDQKRSLYDTCKLRNSDGECTECFVGYVLNNGACDEAIDNCALYSEDSICLRCENEYHLQRGLCYEHIENCAEYNTDSSCAQCEGSYKLLNDKCIKLVKYCEKYTHSGDCERFYQDFLPIRNKIVLLNCLEFDQNDECIKCHDKYELKEPYCIPIGCSEHAEGICISCESEFSLINSQCVRKIDNCKNIGKNGYCIECHSEYILFENKCVTEIKDCLTYVTSLECKECKANYILSENSCIQTLHFADPIHKKTIHQTTNAQIQYQ